MTGPTRQPAGTPAGGQFARVQHSEARIDLHPQAPRVWFAENKDGFDDLILAVADRQAVSPLAVEKDYWVCRALRSVTSQYPGEVIFKGGTSLEKMRILQRFSEDLDLLVVGEYPSKNSAKNALRRMAEAAAAGVPGCQVGDPVAGGKPGSYHRAVHLGLRLRFADQGAGMADPQGILIELGQTGGSYPHQSHDVTSILAAELAATGIDTLPYGDLAPFAVECLHPGRTLIEKLLRVNNFAVDPSRRSSNHGWPRIGRQFYDIWALLGDRQVLDLLEDRSTSGAVMEDAIAVSAVIRPDSPPPRDGFSASPVFNPRWEGYERLRTEHDSAMDTLYFGAEEPPSMQDVLDRVASNAELLDFA